MYTRMKNKNGEAFDVNPSKRVLCWWVCLVIVAAQARLVHADELDDEELILDPIETEEPDGSDPDDIRLGPVDIQHVLEDISKLGGSVQAVGEKQLDAFKYDDPQRVLGQTSGVYVRQEDGFGLRPNIGLRGANSERSRKVTLMEDGVLFGPAPYSAPAAYYFPMMGRMVGVEVFKGPGSIMYGPSTIGGAINLRTREVPASGMTGALDGSFGNFMTAKAHGYGGIGWDYGGVLLEGMHLQSDGFKDLDGAGANGSADDTGFSRSEFMAKGRINTDPNKEIYHRIDLKAGYSREQSNETYLGLTDADFAATPYRRYVGSGQDHMGWWRTQAQVSYTLEWDTDFDLTATLYRHDFHRVWRKLNRFRNAPGLDEILASPTGRRAVFYDVLTGRADSASADEALMIGANDRTFASQGAQVVAKHRYQSKAWSNQAEVGLRLHHDWIERLHSEDPYLMQGGLLVAEAGSQTTFTTKNKGESVALAVHLLDQVSFGDFTLTPGLRFEWIDMGLTDKAAGTAEVKNTQAVFIPGFGAHYAITEAFGVLAGVHRGFTPVSPGQPQEVEPEFSVNYEAGVRYSVPEEETVAEVIGFFNDYSNLTGNCGFSSGCADALIDRQFNAGSVFVYGVEVVGSHTWASPSLGLTFPTRLVYTFTASRFRESFISDDPQFGEVEEGDALPYVPEHQGSVQAGVAWSGISANLSFGFVSAMREQAGHDGDGSPMTDTQYLLDALVSYRFLDHFEVYGRGDNLLNVDPIGSRRPFGARPVRPLMGQFGVKVFY